MSSASRSRSPSPRRSGTSQVHVLCIQSSVVYGYVGNKSAVFPLQLHGIEADPLNTCQFSNHSGYPHIRHGQFTTPADLADMFHGLRANKLMEHYSHILTGYIPNDALFDGVTAAIKTLKAERRRASPAPSSGSSPLSGSYYSTNALKVLCDPVMGDDGSLYVPETFVAKYRDNLLPLADITTPNQTEAELLTGVTITDLASARLACNKLHALGPRTVFITSATFAPAMATTANGETVPVPVTEDDLEVDITPSYSRVRQRLHPEDVADVLPEMIHEEIIHAFASERLADGTTNQYHLRLPRYPVHFAGTGDLATALLFAQITRHSPLQTAFEQAMAAVHSTIRKTLVLGRQELALVQSRAELLEPTVTAMATPLH